MSKLYIRTREVSGGQVTGPEADAATTQLEAAKFRRDGAMIALLAVMPMRRRSFVELELGTSFEG